MKDEAKPDRPRRVQFSIRSIVLATIVVGVGLVFVPAIFQNWSGFIPLSIIVFVIVCLGECALSALTGFFFWLFSKMFGELEPEEDE